MLEQIHRQIERILRRRAHASSVIVSPQSGMIDTHAMAVNEGRREVFLRIASHLHLNDADLLRIKEETQDE
jgi:hypothetical protein